MNAEFPLAKLIVRSYDREHALYLSKKNVSLMVRETFESALVLGQMALQQLGASQDEIQQVSEDIRALDNQRFETEVAADDVKAGIGIQYTQRNPRPTAPLIKPQHKGQLLNDAELEKLREVDDRT